VKIGNPLIPAIIAMSVGLLAGCASVPQGGVAHAAEVRVYEPEQLAPGQYDTLRYLWVDSWHAAFWLPGSRTEAEGIAALQTEAARLGANGLINVSCRNQGHSQWSWSRDSDVVCYGSAIRVRQTP